MKRVAKKILFVFIIIFLLVFTSGFIFVWLKGKTLIKEALTKAIKKEVNISAVSLRLPFSLEIKDLEISDFAQVDKVLISPVVIGFLKGKVILGQISLIQPRFSIGKTADGNWNLPEGILEKIQNKQAGQAPVLISGLFVKNGNIKFKDETKTPAFNFSIRNINLDIGNKILSFNPILIRFLGKAEIVAKEDQPVSVLRAKGWVDFLKKDMRGMVELSDLDAVYFLPLYSKYMTSNLKNAVLNFKSDLAAKNNDLVANCRLLIKNLVFEKNKDETAPSISFFDIVAGGLVTENKEVNVDFVIKTKLDHPKIDLVKLSGSVMAKALGEQMMQNPEQTVENIKSVGKQFEKLGKEILKDKLGIDLEKKKEKAAPASPPPQQETPQQSSQPQNVTVP